MPNEQTLVALLCMAMDMHHAGHIQTDLSDWASDFAEAAYHRFDLSETERLDLRNDIVDNLDGE